MALKNFSHDGGQVNVNSGWFRWTAEGTAADIVKPGGFVCTDTFANSPVAAGSVVRLVGERDKATNANCVVTNQFVSVCYPMERRVTYTDRDVSYGILHEEGSAVKTRFGKLGSFDQTFNYGNTSVSVKKICVVPHSAVGADVTLDVLNKNGIRLAQFIVRNGTQAFKLVAFPVNKDVTGDVTIKVNAPIALANSIDCTVSIVSVPFEETMLHHGEASLLASTSDLGNFDHTFVFGEFVRVKGFEIVPKAATLLDIALELHSVANVLIPATAFVIPAGTADRYYTSVADYVTKSAHLVVNAGVISPTAADVYVIYEPLGSKVEYSYCIPNSNAATSPYCPLDAFDATISKAEFTAKPGGNGWVKGNFSVSLINDANNVAANVDCGNLMVSPVLANNVLVPANRLKLTNVATGGSTNPVAVKVTMRLS